MNNEVPLLKKPKEHVYPEAVVGKERAFVSLCVGGGDLSPCKHFPIKKLLLASFRAGGTVSDILEAAVILNWEIWQAPLPWLDRRGVLGLLKGLWWSADHFHCQMKLIEMDDPCPAGLD